ncbi:MAG TPA: FHA domain-containing protein [candidate division Zixibacteria bacterium]|nr:FHA domain-containing protein [candidate division Zixibacteria bacterium]
MNDTAVLIAREGQLTGERWQIDTKEFVIGRGADCQIMLPERQVSRYHAKIVRENGRYILHDLDSKNGTHLNGVQVKGSSPIRDGDEIQIALCVKLLFIGTDATIPLTVEEIEPKGNLELDFQQRAVTMGGIVLDPPLSLAQFRLLETLYKVKGAVVDRDSIVDVVWPGTGGMGVTEQAIDALVRRLRDRLTEIDEYEYVVTVRGHGFRLDNEPH